MRRRVPRYTGAVRRTSLLGRSHDSAPNRSRRSVRQLPYHPELSQESADISCFARRIVLSLRRCGVGSLPRMDPTKSLSSTPITRPTCRCRMSWQEPWTISRPTRPRSYFAGLWSWVQVHSLVPSAPRLLIRRAVNFLLTPSLHRWLNSGRIRSARSAEHSETNRYDDVSRKVLV